MTRLLFVAPAIMIVALGSAAVLAQDVKAKQAVKDILGKPGDSGQVCTGDFGTEVKFVATPSDAGNQALKEEKLVLVLHVSGEFEDPAFT